MSDITVEAAIVRIGQIDVLEPHLEGSGPIVREMRESLASERRRLCEFVATSSTNIVILGE